jgi:hypothetical protein
MMAMLLVAGIVVIAAGLLAIVLGIPVKEFSLGNTLILAGTVAASAGLILIGLARVVRELQNIVRLATPRPRPASDLSAAPAGNQAATAPDPAESSSSPPAAPVGGVSPDPASDQAIAASAEPAPVKPRRNLLFSSSRRERERAAARPAEQAAPEPAPAPPVAAPAVKETATATFDDAWPQSERARSDAMLRRARTPSSAAEPDGGTKPPERPAPAARSEEPPRGEEPPPVTVLKSGVVDGMAYSLYSDGSIEAQMPEGMMRFASIDELRSHLDQRP